MTEPSEAVKAMARRIVKKVCAEQHVRDDGWVSAYMEDAALAAILETQRLDAELVESFDLRDIRASEHAIYLATAIRTGNHYAKDHSNDR